MRGAGAWCARRFIACVRGEELVRSYGTRSKGVKVTRLTGAERVRPGQKRAHSVDLAFDRTLDRQRRDPRVSSRLVSFQLDLTIPGRQSRLQRASEPLAMPLSGLRRRRRRERAPPDSSPARPPPMEISPALRRKFAPGSWGALLASVGEPPVRRHI
jgi:hypothetical protein